MEPVAMLATVGAFAVVVKGVIDAARRQVPALDGWYVQALAVALGFGAAWTFDVQATQALIDSYGVLVGRIPPDGIDYLITGAAIAAGAGFFAEVAGRSGRPTPVEPDRELAVKWVDGGDAG